MKAYQITGPEDYAFADLPEPELGPGEVFIAVRAVGLCGSDRHYLMKDYPINFGDNPFIPGHEGAGEILEVGQGVTSLKVGDRVAIEPARPCRQCHLCWTGHGNVCPDVQFLGHPPVDGLLREKIAYPAEYVVADPSGQLTYDDLMMLEPLAIAFHTLDEVGFRVGWTAYVGGCGSIGLTLIATLKKMGAGKIVASDPLAYKGEWAKKLGADVYIQTDPSDIKQRALEANHGHGFDVTFECAGQVAQNQAAQVVRPGGKVALIGINHENRIELDHPDLRRGGVTLLNIRRSNETLERAIEMAAANEDLRLGFLVTHHTPFAEARSAFERFVCYGDGVVKAVIEPNPA